jgi:F-type H+-transporting ATPase subunit gamma
MSQERSLRARLRTLATLHEAVGALRSLSAHHFRVARAALPEARAYRREIEADLAVLAGAPAPPRAPGAVAGMIVIGADLGLCGDYSTRVAGCAALALRPLAAGRVYCVGRRVQRPLERAGIRAARCYDAPASVGGIARVLLPLVSDVVADREAGEVDAVVLVSARFAGAGRFTPVATQVLPVAASTDGEPLAPSPYVRRAHLVAEVSREFLYVALFESFLDALAAEHGKRLVAAEGAWGWLAQRMAAVERQVASVRRESATQEVLEVASGARRLRAAAWRP